MSRHKWLQLFFYLFTGACIGYGIGLLLSYFKTTDHVTTYNFQTHYVPEILALFSLLPAYLLYWIMRNLQRISEKHQMILKSMASVIAKKDDETEGHCERVAQYAMMLGKVMGIHGLQLQQLGWGAYLHDLGKIAIPDRILLKPGKLTDDEWEIMKTHVNEGFRILMDHHFLDKGLDIILFHHEKWDGSGYPHGLSGKRIPQLARIFSIVDSFDAMTSNRPYRKSMTISEAKAEVRRCSGTQFCPIVVDYFLSISDDQLAQIFQGKAAFPGLQPLPNRIVRSKWNMLAAETNLNGTNSF